MSSAAHGALVSQDAAPAAKDGWGRPLSLAAAALGFALAALLVRSVGLAGVVRLVMRAGWWLPVVLALHLPQTLLSAAGWSALLPAGERPSLARLYLFRWIRESVNGLLPVAQVGGEVVRARLLARDGFGAARAGASCALDVTLELAAQVVFTLAGLALLVRAAPHAAVVRAAGAALGALILLVAGLAAVQRLARTERLRALGARLTRRWPGMERVGVRAGPRQQLASGGWHLASWFAGALETWAALHAVGLKASAVEAVVVESLTQVVRVAAFAVPGAIGVQEGALILICGLFGVPPAAAVGVSLVRRIREGALGAPGLLAWRWAEVGR